MSNSEREIEQGRDGQAGFTLIEALIAVVILIFGLASIANLMVVAGSSNKVAGHSTAATAAATEQMELLKAMPVGLLTAGGDAPTIDFYDANGIQKDPGPPCTPNPVGIYNCSVLRKMDLPTGDIQGGGTIHVRWRVVDTPAPNTKYIEVQAQSVAPAMARRSRARLTTFRTF